MKVENPIKELRLTEQQFRELVETYDMFVEEIETFLNIETGDVVTLMEFDEGKKEEELRESVEDWFNEIYFRIPQRDSREG